MLDFDSDFDPGFDRDRILSDAARFLDVDAGYLSGNPTDGANDLGDLVRAFSQDEASLGQPQVFAVKREALEAAASSIPVSVREFSRGARFYWVSFPVSLFAAVGRGFNRLEVKYAFNHDGDGDGEAVRPTTVSILPERQWVTRLEIGAEMSVGVTADLKVVVGLPEELATLTGLPVSGQINPNVTSDARLVLGPFKWTLRCPEVEHTGPELDHVFWRLSGARFLREQDPGLRVLLRVPNGLDALAITGQLRVRRYYNLFEPKLAEAIRTLPAALQSFFSERGTQIMSTKRWDLTHTMDAG